MVLGSIYRYDVKPRLARAVAAVRKVRFKRKVRKAAVRGARLRVGRGKGRVLGRADRAVRFRGARRAPPARYL